MGQTPTDEELFQMINDVDDNASGSIGTFYFSNIFLSLFRTYIFFIARRLYRVPKGCGETERKNSKIR